MQVSASGLNRQYPPPKLMFCGISEKLIGPVIWVPYSLVMTMPQSGRSPVPATSSSPESSTSADGCLHDQAADGGRGQTLEALEIVVGGLAQRDELLQQVL